MIDNHFTNYGLLSEFITLEQVSGVQTMTTPDFCSLESDSRYPPQMSHLLNPKGNSFLYTVIFKARILLRIASVGHMGTK